MEQTQLETLSNWSRGLLQRAGEIPLPSLNTLKPETATAVAALIGYALSAEQFVIWEKEYEPTN